MLLAVDLHEDFIDVESVTVSAMSPLQSPGVYRSKFDAPKADGFPADDDAAFSQDIFDISVTEIEAVVKPDCVTDDVGRESVELIGVHGAILSIWPSQLVSTQDATGFWINAE